MKLYIVLGASVVTAVVVSLVYIGATQLIDRNYAHKRLMQEFQYIEFCLDKAATTTNSKWKHISCLKQLGVYGAAKENVEMYDDKKTSDLVI